MAQRFKDEAGNIWEMGPNGQPSLVSAAHNPGLANPKLPGELTGQGLSNQKTAFELQQLHAQASADTRIKNAQAIQEEQKAADAKFAAGDALGDPNLSGAARFASIPKDKQPMVRLLLDNNLQQLGGFALGKPALQSLISTAKAVDPTFDPSVFGIRYGAMRDFSGGGKNATLVGAAERLALNLQQLKSISDKMGGPNVGFRPVNAMLASGKEAFEPKLSAGYDALLPEIANQFDLFMKTKGTPTVTGTAEVMKGLRRGQSQDERDAAIEQVVKAIRGGLEPIKGQWQSAYGGNSSPPMWISPEAARFYEQIDPEHTGSYQPNDRHGIPGLHGMPGETLPPGSAPPPADPNAPPPPINGGPGGVPHADYSSVGQGPNYSVAQQGYRNVADPETTAAVNALIHHGKSYDEVAAYAASRGYPGIIEDRRTFDKVQTYAKSHPGFQAVGEATKPVPTTAWQRFSAGPAAAAITGFGAGSTAGLQDVVGRTLAGPGWDANRDALAATHPYADLAGNVAGGTAGMFAGGKVAASVLRSGADAGVGRNALALAMKNPIASNVLGDTAYGATYGASENPDDPLSGAALGAVMAPFASLGGQYGTKAIGAGLHGVTDPAVQRLRAAGIPLTVGEVLGGGAKKAQDAMTSIFGPGNMVSRRYGEGREALNQAAFNQGGQIIDQPINAVGHKGIQALDAAKNQAYTAALDPVSLNLNDPNFFSDLRTARTSARGIPNVDQASQIAEGGLDNYIANPALNNGGILSGRDFQQGYRGLSRLGAQSKDRIYGHEIGQSLGQGQDALVGALESQNPTAFDNFLKANMANRHLSVLTDAVNLAKNQIGDKGEPLFTPAQLGTAASSNARTYNGKLAAASGNRPFNQLATDAQKVMSSKLPESGTFPRQLMGLALTGGLSGAGGMFGGEANGTQGAAEGALIPLSLLTFLGTRRGQKLLTAALANRPTGLQYAGQMVGRNPQVGGDILTAAGIPLLAGR